MPRIGIIGLGMMGRTHYEAYKSIPNAQVVAIADLDPRRAAGDLAGTAGNILEGGLNHLPMDEIRGTTDYRQILEMSDVDVVDICVPTPAHTEVAVAALESGKHVISEKPLARTSAQAKQIAEAAAKAKGFFMPAMCMRFWPQWAWLKQAVEEQRYGKVLSATFRRVAQMPGSPWYHQGEQSGGALLDLHVHDVDFVYYLFGMPEAVFSRGYSKTTNAIDHMVSQYLYKDGPLMVAAEGGWCLSDGFGFSMQYTVNFEKATADFDLGRTDPLIVSHDGESEKIECGEGTGYMGELKYFIECVEQGRKPEVVTADQGVDVVRLVEAEAQSSETGQIVKL